MKSIILKLSVVCSGLLWLLLLLHVGLLNGQSEKVFFQHLNIENGLSNNSINCVVQDDDGYIWIGTENGLNKYNGYAAKVFYPNNADSCGDLKTSVNCAFKDSKGRLWFGATGLILCNPENESFKVFRFETRNPKSIISDDIFKIVEDENFNIWIGTRNGLVLFNEETNDFTRFRHDTIGSTLEVYSRNRIIDMISDKNGNLWMTSLMGMYQFSINDRSFHPHLLKPEQSSSRFANQSHYLCLGKDGVIWINYYGNGIYQFDINTKRYSKVIFPGIEMSDAAMRVSAMVCDSKQNIWVATSFNGILYFDESKRSWMHLQHDLFNTRSLADNSTSCLFEDHSGLMWIGTGSKGVDRINMNRLNFMNYVLQPGKPNSLCENDITCVVEDHHSNLWIGSRSGLMYFDRKLNQFTCYKHDKSNPNSISDNSIYCIEIDSLHNLWIATENGLNYFKPELNKWTRYNDEEGNKNSLASRQVFDIKIRRNGEVWLATSNLICRFDHKTGSFENRNNNPKIEALYHAFYTTLFEDHENIMWLSTARSGIYKVDEHFNLLKSYRKSGGFNANMVHQFVEDSLGTIWMASDRGIYFKNKGEDQIRKLNNQEDILNGDIKSIQIESNTKIWVSTLSGLVYLTLNEDRIIQSIKIFTDKDGLQSKAFNTFAGTRLRSGELFFGGINGFNIFYPSTIKYNSVIPSVKLVGFKVENLETHPGKKEDNQYFLELNYDQNDFSFEMASLNYDIIDNNLYKYQLIGYDKEINLSGTNRFAQYTNVPPGKYQLKIMGSNNDGFWNEEGYTLNLTIHPPFWKTLWFQIFMIFAIGLLGSVIYSWRVNSIRKQEKVKSDIEKKIAEARSVALRAQMNPHFIFNSLNSIQHLISESEKADAHKYLSKFSKLMRLVLENSNKNVNTVESETEMLRLYLDMEILRFANRFTYEIQIGKDPSILHVEIPSMLLHPFVENAVIHGLLNKTEPGHLKIALETKNSNLICIIEDDGIGRQAAEEIKNKKKNTHKSRGLQVTEDRIKMIETITNKSAQVKIEDLKNLEGLSTGTRVVIEIPIETHT